MTYQLQLQTGARKGTRVFGEEVQAVAYAQGFLEGYDVKWKNDRECQVGRATMTADFPLRKSLKNRRLTRQAKKLPKKVWFWSGRYDGDDDSAANNLSRTQPRSSSKMTTKPTTDTSPKKRTTRRAKAATSKAKTADTPAKTTTVPTDAMIPLKRLCQEFELDPKMARRTLRKKLPRSGDNRARWAWQDGSEELAKVREILSDVK